MRLVHHLIIVWETFVSFLVKIKKTKKKTKKLAD